jgi:hypothetical protein
MKTFVKSILPIVLAAAGSSCNLLTGPSGSVTGMWSAIGPNPRADSAGLILQQTGDDITGTVCRRSDRFVVYTGVPVHGEYPDLQFDVGPQHLCADCGFWAGRFVGRQDGTKDIVGTFTPQSPGARTYDLRFTRTDRNPCP